MGEQKSEAQQAEALMEIMLALQSQGLKLPLTEEAEDLIRAHPHLFRDVWAADSILGR